MSYFIGLDISKGSIDVCFLEEEERSYIRYTNDAEGLAALVGVAPYARDSGKQCGYRFIRGGRKIPRDSLYNCRHNRQKIYSFDQRPL